MTAATAPSILGDRYAEPALILAGLIATGVAFAHPLWLPALSPTPTIAATVKVATATGHGSGVHIGDGLILTAAHVVRGKDTATIKTTDDTRGAEILWVSDVYDVALLSTSDTDLQAMSLSCDTPPVGSQVTAYGNPMGMEFVNTTGQVIGPVGSALGIPGAYPVDMTIIPGMSGGPLVDVHGQVVGISVAVMTYPAGFGVSLTGIGMAVSGEAVCELMGRV